jgi:hypothetical protein
MHNKACYFTRKNKTRLLKVVILRAVQELHTSTTRIALVQAKSVTLSKGQQALVLATVLSAQNLIDLPT